MVHAWVRRSVRPIPLKDPPSYAHGNVTVVIPTICTDEELPLFEKVLRSLTDARPHSIIIVTPHPRSERIRTLAANVGRNIRVIGSDKKSKRHQVSLGIREVRTEFTILADDDVWWPGRERAIPAFLAPFENPETVAVGTCQAVERENSLNIAQFLGCVYIARRNREFVATSNIDGGLTCLSGRTMIVRTRILQDPGFEEVYIRERWRGRMLNPDDDNCITRYLYSHGKIRIQTDNNAIVYTSLGKVLKIYLAQCIRWERSRYRHTITLLLKHSDIWWYAFRSKIVNSIDSSVARYQPWSTWALYFQAFFHSLLTELLMTYYWYKSKSLLSPQWYSTLTILLVGWGAFAKFYRAFDHYKRYPRDICLFPAHIVFTYGHGLLKFYALVTINKVHAAPFLHKTKS